jgi:hypothetical protein
MLRAPPMSVLVVIGEIVYFWKHRQKLYKVIAERGITGTPHACMR